MSHRLARPKTPIRGAVARPPSEQLAAILRGRGLSLAELGALAGVDACGLGRFLRGEKDLTLGTLDRLAGALGLDLVERSRPRGYSNSKVTPDGHLAPASYVDGRIDEPRLDAEAPPEVEPTP